VTERSFPVESGHVLMFARAIGDDNPVYRDPEYAARADDPQRREAQAG
jgi:acyl dehydratase